MNLITHFRPFRKEHSIKEAVITLFLENEISNVEDFGKLLNNPLKFETFDIITKQHIKFKIFDPSNLSNNIENMGFQFSNKKEGENTEVLRAINDNQNTFIAYHTFDYVRWTPFKNTFFQHLQHLSTTQNDFSIKSFGVYYVDDFFWENTENLIPLVEIFKQDQEIIPKHFFNSQNTIFSLITEQNDNKNSFIERFDIRIEPTSVFPDVPSIRIMHNVVKNLEKSISLSEFLFGDFYKNLIQDAHIHNKNMMSQILKQEVLNLINLK